MEKEVTQFMIDSNYSLEQFNDEEINKVVKLISHRTNKKGDVIDYIHCGIRDKDMRLTPEELVRQLYIVKLMDTYRYPKERIELEYSVSFGREKKRADIVIFDKDNALSPYIIVELKKPKLKDGKEQLKSYCNATGAPIGVWTNGEQISYYNRKDPNYFEDIPNIPNATEKLSDILTERWTIDDLVLKDKLITEKFLNELKSYGVGIGNAFEDEGKHIKFKLQDLGQERFTRGRNEYTRESIIDRLEAPKKEVKKGKAENIKLASYDKKINSLLDYCWRYKIFYESTR